MPFQLFLNECLAVGQVRAQRTVEQSFIAFVIFSQILTCFVTLFIGIGGERLSVLSIFCFALSFAIANFISFNFACQYYDLVLNGRLAKRESILLGMVPGLTMLLLYSGFFELLSKGFLADSFYLAFLVPAPALVQYCFFKFALGGTGASSILKTPKIRSIAFCGYLSVWALMIVSYFITDYRVFFSQLAPAYGALIVVGLNTLSSIANTVTRAGFLARGYQMYKVLFLMGASACILSLIIMQAVDSMIVSFVMLLGLQFIMIAVIEHARGLVVASSTTR